MSNEYERLRALVIETRRSFVKSIDSGERSGTEVIDAESLLPDWKKEGVNGDGEHTVGECCIHVGQSWKCVQAHNTNNNPDIEPSKSPAQWVPFHTKNPSKAKPFIKPTMAEDSYYLDECCVFEGKVYRSTMATANAYSPTEYPQGWEEVQL